MHNKKNILICLETLNIGGVETYVLTQAINLIELGHTVVIISKKGIYSKILEEKGAICIENEFELENNFNLEKIDNIVKIIEKYNIDEIYINQFPCILSVLPACVILNKPYVAYAHCNVKGVYEWFMETFSIYKNLFELFFKNAYKIITITDSGKNEVVKNFNIDEKKVMVINNSINFEEFKCNSYNSEKIEKFLIISRLAKEKEKSIYNGINLFLKYAEKNSKISLDIVGDGESKENIEKYIKENNTNNIAIRMLGAKNNVKDFIAESDAVMGLDRCILEAIAMKKLAIITGYEDIKQIVTPENILEAIKQNFSGENLEDSSINKIIEEISMIDNNKAKSITEENYKVAFEKLNIKNNYYVIEDIYKRTDREYKEIIRFIINIQNQVKELENNIINKVEESKEKIKNLKEKVDEKENEKRVALEEIKEKEREKNSLNEEIRQLKKELEEVYNSKRWRYTEKITKLFK